jgi:hypothetical protein
LVGSVHNQFRIRCFFDAAGAEDCRHSGFSDWSVASTIRS